MALIYRKAANRIKAPNTQIGKNNVSIFDKNFPNEINRIAVWNGYATSSREVSNKQMKHNKYKGNPCPFFILFDRIHMWNNNR